MERLGFGVLMFPIHRPDHDPALQLDDDLRLAELCDRLGYDEFWFGEHHTGGWQIIASPELMIAAAAQRTGRIKLGTGVSTLSYHHPLTLLDRIVQLDHMTRGRLVFGVGSGALVLDAARLGHDPARARAMMGEALEAITTLLATGGPVTRRTDWFELVDASLHLMPYSDPLDVRVAAFRSPSGPRYAGRYGTGLLSFGAAAAVWAGAENPMATAWSIVEGEAALVGRPVDRRRWSVTSPVHVAETDAEARRDVRWGIGRYLGYVGRILPMDLPVDLSDVDATVDLLHAVGHAAIGTPERAIAHIEALLEISGGFGTFVIEHGDLADPAASRRSYELFAREVMPHFTGRSAARRAAHARELAAGGSTRRSMAAPARPGVEPATDGLPRRPVTGSTPAWPDPVPPGPAAVPAAAEGAGTGASEPAAVPMPTWPGRPLDHLSTARPPDPTERP